jgi:hypothetical protein
MPLDVHLEFVAAGEAAEELQQLAFLRFIDTILLAMSRYVDHGAVLRFFELAIVDMFGHGGSPRKSREKSAGPHFVPGRSLY